MSAAPARLAARNAPPTMPASIVELSNGFRIDMEPPAQQNVCFYCSMNRGAGKAAGGPILLVAKLGQALLFSSNTFGALRARTFRDRQVARPRQFSPGR